MWIFTQHGMISAVAHREFAETLLVRSRVKGHLEAFLGGRDLEIVTTDQADYQFRVVVPKSLFVTLMEEQTQAVDYDNFKGRVDSLPEKTYARLLHTVWQRVYDALAKN